MVLASLILLSSLFHFSDTDSKTEDHCFVGFPAIWNIVAFYVFAFAMPLLGRRRRVLGLRGADVRAHALGAPPAHAAALAGHVGG